MKILIEGWRGINHSYALVNQYQILEFLQMGMEVYHTDIPFFNRNWNPSANPSGFDDESAGKINAVAAYSGQPIDCIYRISYPYRLETGGGHKTFTFGTAEFKHVSRDMISDGDAVDYAAAFEQITIVTPSRWSAKGFLNLGFPERNVKVVPHGVDPAVFYPLAADERKKARAFFGMHDSLFVFTNIGAMSSNKGIDVLIIAFAVLRKKYPQIRLILKDQSSLYGLRPDGILKDVAQRTRNLVDQTLIDSIVLISGNLDLKTLRLLYGATDMYVSPYRAEGFNLTPLEAAACGTPIIVTKGGSTDDYCSGMFNMLVDAVPRSIDAGGSFLEPVLDSLVSKMESGMFNSVLRSRTQTEGSSWVRSNYSWEAVTRKLVRVLSE